MELARSRWPFCVLPLVVGAACALALFAAPPFANLSDWVAALASPGADTPLALSLWEVRMPRLVLAATIGAGLAVGGLVMQTLSGNPLATPSILGVTNGAALGLVLAIAWIDRLTEGAAILAAFAGAAASALVIGLVGFARQSAVRGDALVVAGSILGAFAGSIVTAIVFFHSLQNELLGWTLGRLVHVDWLQARFAVPAVALGLWLAAVCAGRLEALRLGETTARELGVPVRRVRAAAVVSVILLTGGSVAAAGPVAYVGLIVPHLLRNARLTPHARLWACAALGATLTTTADLLARLTSGERLIPLGIWTAAMGASLFLSLSLRGPGERSA